MARRGAQGALRMKPRMGAYIVLATGSVFTVFPFVWMLSTSLKTAREASAPAIDLVPQAWQWGNYAAALGAAPFATYFYNTFLVALTVMTSVVITSLLAGYAFARIAFRGRNVLFACLLATMMVPFEVTLIPNFLLVRDLGWNNTYAALIVPWCAGAFSIFLVRQAFLSLPGDFFDAARMDGCGHLRFLAWVAAPLVKPALVTVALFSFLSSYNSLVWPIVVTNSEDMRLIQYGLTVFGGETGVQTNLLMCASTIVILPTVGLYFLAQRS
ncbi:MAG: carbohydrate ABC transporter permease, partial [Candidatus Hydrogenedentes bacterium]|nr:carbohydrate ABC transporter permease [Candidatus Hydrogenedentota bacterium]